MLCVTPLPISNRASFLSLKISIKDHLWWTDNADRMRSGSLIPLFLHKCVAAVIGNAPLKFEALIFFTFNDINKNVRPQAPQAAQAPMCYSTRPLTTSTFTGEWTCSFLPQWPVNKLSGSVLPQWPAHYWELNVHNRPGLVTVAGLIEDRIHLDLK